MDGLLSRCSIISLVFIIWFMIVYGVVVLAQNNTSGHAVQPTTDQATDLPPPHSSFSSVACSIHCFAGIVRLAFVPNRYFEHYFFRTIRFSVLDRAVVCMWAMMGIIHCTEKGFNVGG
jgi:hypothetical protein